MTTEGGRVRGLRGLVVALVLTVVALGGTAAPARAESRDIPDLALVVADRTVTLHPGDAQFSVLWQLLEPMETRTERVPEAWTRGRYPRVRATVVWALTGIGGWPCTRRAPGGDVAIE